MPYDAATVEDARQMRVQVWTDRLNGRITQAEFFEALRRLRAEWKEALYSR